MSVNPERFQPGDKVIVRGLDMAFVVVCYLGGMVKLFIEGENEKGMHQVIHAREEVLLPNNKEGLRKDGWL